MFPFDGKLADIRAVNAYTKEDIKKILQKCEEYEFEVIPLIQTFGKQDLLKMELGNMLRTRNKLVTTALLQSKVYVRVG